MEAWSLNSMSMADPGWIWQSVCEMRDKSRIIAQTTHYTVKTYHAPYANDDFTKWMAMTGCHSSIGFWTLLVGIIRDGRKVEV